MNLSMFLSISAILGLAHGLGFALAPDAMSNIYGTHTDAAGHLLGRFFGVTLLEVGLITWLMRHKDEVVLRPLLVGSFWGILCGLGVSLYGMSAGLFNAMGWSAIAIYALLAVGYAYYAYMHHEELHPSAHAH
ncbi:MAG: hypothetical protein RL020_1158 [Pseudomonadota bacterium]